MSTKKRCNSCKRLKLLKEFSYSKFNSDGHQRKCKVCSHKYEREYYYTHEKVRILTKKRIKEKERENRIYIYQYKKTHPCVDCGEKDPRCLIFDHVRGKKKNNVGSLMTNTLGQIKKEIKKCVIRCANCHAKRTSKQQGWYAYLGIV